MLSVAIVPLRQRPEDIPILARHFVKKYAVEFSRSAREFAQDAVDRLVSYSWPGNARELENVIERAVLSCEGPFISGRDLELPSTERRTSDLSYQARKNLMVTSWECDELKRMLAAHRGNVSAMARAEGKDAGALRALLRRHHLRPDRASPYWETRI